MDLHELPRFSPWGPPQHWTPTASPDVWFVSTASHGGCYVAGDALDAIPDNLKEWAASWSHGMGHAWFEEDCCWAAVAITHPFLFTLSEQEAARRTLDRYFPAAFSKA